MVQQYKDVKGVNAGDYAFSILRAVAQQNFTKWSIVYDITNRSVRFVTSESTHEKKIDLKALDFACSANPMTADMNEKIEGSINNSFSPFSSAANRKMLMRAFDESRSQISISLQNQEAMADLASRVRCR